MLKAFLFLLCLVNINAYAETSWNLNDVSYLYSIEDTKDLLTPISHTEKLGALLPKAVYSNIPNVIAGSGNERIYDQNLKVVGVRVDPCPTFDAANCGQAEVRMIWQPIEWDIDDKINMGRDGAVHTFYLLDNDEIKSLIQDLGELKSSFDIATNQLPLNIHPFMNNKQFTARLNQTFLKYCGEKNLSKVTFMSLLVATRWWRFGSFEKDSNGKWYRADIPRVEHNFIDIFNTASEGRPANNFPGEKVDAIFNILPETYPEQDNIFSVINNSYRYNDDRDYEVFKSKIHAVRRFQNPHRTNPKTLDCASCHYADATLYYSEKRFPGIGETFSSDEFLNPNDLIHNLENTTVAKKATRVIRAFGYFGNRPAINQRAINESAAVANWLNLNEL